MKFYRGPAKAARAYVESDHSRADDYYLAEGSGVAQWLVATPDGVSRMDDLDGDAFESWVAGIDLETGRPKGRVRQDANALRYIEVTVNGPKTWSLAAALHPEVSAALDAAQDRAAGQIVGWVAQHTTTRVGPRGRQVQVPVEQSEAAVIWGETNRPPIPRLRRSGAGSLLRRLSDVVVELELPKRRWVVLVNSGKHGLTCGNVDLGGWAKLADFGLERISCGIPAEFRRRGCPEFRGTSVEASQRDR